MKLANEDPSKSNNISCLKCYMDSHVMCIESYLNVPHRALCYISKLYTQCTIFIQYFYHQFCRRQKSCCDLSRCLLIKCTEQLYFSDHLIAKAKVMQQKKNYSSSFLSGFLSKNYSSTLRMCDSRSRTPYVSPITCKQ